MADLQNFDAFFQDARKQEMLPQLRAVAKARAAKRAHIRNVEKPGASHVGFHHGLPSDVVTKVIHPMLGPDHGKGKPAKARKRRPLKKC